MSELGTARSPRSVPRGETRASARSARTGPAVRCAVYTRKSSEEGLEQEFNSLHAQREACEAYIQSQRSEGWLCLADPYDDGGISGGTMDRPGLQRLLSDVKAGRIDTVVVYKVDRLTRSLSDFAKIVDVFDQAGASFVSVTQSFNTTTSMGRLTLNMLLSFAQFEREVTSERIRDKIGASKRKGMWTGGTVPLGYDAVNTRLVVNEEEAGTVREIFTRYLTLGNVRDVRLSLIAEGRTGKPPRDGEGRITGPGKPFTHDGPLYHLLQNRLYRGQIAYKGEVHQGQHAAIVEGDLFDAVQAKLQENRVRRSYGTPEGAPALLTGLLFDARGQRVTPTHANKRGRRYRYYASQCLIGRRERGAEGVRVPATDIDGLVLGRIERLLADRGALHDLLTRQGVPPDVQEQLLDKAAALAATLTVLPAHTQRALALQVIGRVQIHQAEVEIVLRERRLLRLIESGKPELPEEALGLAETETETETEQTERPGPTGHNPARETATPGSPGRAGSGNGSSDETQLLRLTVPAAIRRAGMEMRLVLEEGAADAETRAPDPALVRLIAQAHRLRKLLLDHQGRSLGRLAEAAGLSDAYVARILRLAFLAPDIAEAILEGRQPVTLTANRLANLKAVPMDWNAQRTLLAFPERG